MVMHNAYRCVIFEGTDISSRTLKFRTARSRDRNPTMKGLKMNNECLKPLN